MGCAPTIDRPKVPLTGLQRRILSRLERSPARTGDLTSFWTHASTVRAALALLVERSLVVPASRPEVTVTGSRNEHRSVFGRTVVSDRTVHTTLRADPDGVRTGELWWRLTSWGEDAAFGGLTVPAHGWRSSARVWCCPRGTRMRLDAIARLRQGERPLPPRPALQAALDDVAFALTALHPERVAFAELGEPWPELAGRSPTEVLTGDLDALAEVVAVVDSRVAAAKARQTARERSADTHSARVARLSARMSARAGFVLGRPRWCCGDVVRSVTSA